MGLDTAWSQTLRLNIYCMIVGEIWRYIPHGKKSYFPRPVPKWNVIFLGESSYLPNVHAISCLFYIKRQVIIWIHSILFGFLFLQSNNVVNVNVFWYKRDLKLRIFKELIIWLLLCLSSGFFIQMEWKKRWLLNGWDMMINNIIIKVGLKYILALLHVF